MKKNLFTLTAFIFFSILFIKPVFSQTIDSNQSVYGENLEGIVQNVITEREVEEYGEKRLYQELQILVKKGSIRGDIITVKNGEVPTVNLVRYEKGDLLVINYSKSIDGERQFLIADHVRRDSLLILFFLFVVFAIVVGKIWGLTSILGMAFSFLVIFKFILPQIVNGSNPVFIAILGSMFITPVTFYLSHGFNNKTHIAIVGTIVALFVTGVLAAVFVELSKLTGFATEEAGFLNFQIEGVINMKGMLLAGIIIGTLGVLDDVTVSQSSIVFQLHEVNKKLRFGELFSSAMKVGHDHVSSVVNTLVLVYTGASMPLLLLFVTSNRSFSEIINYEIIADEIVRTLVGSIGLILAVPLTTLMAVYFITKYQPEKRG